MFTQRAIAVGAALFACTIALAVAPAQADHNWRNQLNRYYEQQRRELHEERKDRFDQLRYAHEHRREALEDRWKHQREYLRGEARSHFDRQYHRQREAMERDYHRQVRSLQQWLDYELDRLREAQEHQRERYEYRDRRYPDQYRGAYEQRYGPRYDYPYRSHHRYRPPGYRQQGNLHLRFGNLQFNIPLGD